jgi:hypothetical protein
MIGGVTLLPYNGMGQSKQLQSPNIWGLKYEDHKFYYATIIRMASHMKKKISSLL